ncbi:hypothetical protein QYF36_023880 [Acer negundo]|nr:hypothetical protein QYF36_023880 [Acer negundo]
MTGIRKCMISGPMQSIQMKDQRIGSEGNKGGFRHQKCKEEILTMEWSDMAIERKDGYDMVNVRGCGRNNLESNGMDDLSLAELSDERRCFQKRALGVVLEFLSKKSIRYCDDRGNNSPLCFQESSKGEVLVEKSDGPCMREEEADLGGPPIVFVDLLSRVLMIEKGVSRKSSSKGGKEKRDKM